MEDKRLGDMAVTEGWASLFQHLVTEPAWLNRRLDVPRVEQLANEGAVSLLYFARRYCAKLLYEIEFFQADDPAIDAAALRGAADRGAEAAGRTPRATSTTSTARSTSPATCARGPSRRSCATSCAASTATSGSRGARRAGCCASCGRSARARRPTICCATSPAPTSRWPSSPSASARARRLEKAAALRTVAAGGAGGANRLREHGLRPLRCSSARRCRRSSRPEAVSRSRRRPCRLQSKPE